MECSVRNIPAHTSTSIAKVAKSTKATQLINNSRAPVATPTNIKLLEALHEEGFQSFAKR